MNAEPHVHQVTLERRYGTLDEGGWRVVYGDTEVPVGFLSRLWIDHAPRLPSDRKIRRAIRKAVREHDAGSVSAGRLTERRTSVVADANDRLGRGESWGVDRLAAK